MRRRRLAVLLGVALLAACSTSTGDDAASSSDVSPTASGETSAEAAPTTEAAVSSDLVSSSGAPAASGSAEAPDSSGPTGSSPAAATEASGSGIGADDTGSAPGDTGSAPGDAASASTGATGSDAGTAASASASAPSSAPGSTAAGTTTTTVDPNLPPAVDALAYAVYDMRRGQFLAQSDADAALPVGSLMKMLTAQAAYAAGQPVRMVTAPDSGLVLSEDESNIGIRSGQELSRDLLIRAMLKVSANDAARLLALDIAGSEAAFADQMNAWAANLGLANTHAVNATGLDAEGQYSTANDMTRLAVFLMGNISFQQAVKDPVSQLNGVDFANPNTLLGEYPGADGIKTGHTTGAGWCIVASATRDGHRVVATVLGAPTEEARDAAASALLDWGFAHS